jgi:hypothetical protein
MWGVTLSGPLPVTGLVSRYLANYLMGRRPLLKQYNFFSQTSKLRELIGC